MQIFRNSLIGTRIGNNIRFFNIRLKVVRGAASLEGRVGTRGGVVHPSITLNNRHCETLFRAR
jgi:hypothetical protein